VFAWRSAALISMVILGGLVMIAFLVYERYVVTTPILPGQYILKQFVRSLNCLARLIKAPHCSFIYVQSFCHGVCFFGNYFFCKLL
jgi:hypothetical protein